MNHNVHRGQKSRSRFCVFLKYSICIDISPWVGLVRWVVRAIRRNRVKTPGPLLVYKGDMPLVWVKVHAPL